ncbi:hypothetical protein BDN70DRAFT_932541 [Pholiota conissans]|uniref:Fungal-type protein kinase domain-containing protein n=1 Tax=Pholiota conissans TaxID=109636 RepID=A0A9P5Z1M2_9AGAR|nr:hypothetical protein BDN70DRAFT_932541 [Pholiota conissans]
MVSDLDDVPDTIKDYWRPVVSTLLVIDLKEDEVSSRKLISAVADTMEDISDRNMMFAVDSKGRDLYCNTGRRRTATWQFMSVNLLLHSNKTQTLEDDRESAFWIVLWMALRYSEYNSEIFPATECTDLFNEFCSGVHIAYITGGHQKMAYLRYYEYWGLLFTGRLEIDDLMAYLSTVLGVRYEAKLSRRHKDYAEDLKRRLLMEKQNGDTNEVEDIQAIIDSSVLCSFQSRMDLLASRDWFTKTLRTMWHEANGQTTKHLSHLGSELALSLYTTRVM